MNGLVIAAIGGSCPVQAEGFVGAFPFYFRARGDRWQFAVATNDSPEEHDAVRVLFGRRPGFMLSKSYGDPGGYAAGMMLEEEAERIITECAQAFLATLYSVKARQVTT